MTALNFSDPHPATLAGMRRILLLLLALLAMAQFIRPDTSLPSSHPAQDMIAMTQPGGEVTHLLRTACYDCHSNETKYPWYVNITPVNWWLQHHVNEGREEFNMSEWGGHHAKWQRHKAEEAMELVKEGEMPLDSYTWGHPEARLTAGQRATLTTYFSDLLSVIPESGNGKERSGDDERESH